MLTFDGFIWRMISSNRFSIRIITSSMRWNTVSTGIWLNPCSVNDVLELRRDRQWLLHRVHVSLWADLCCGDVLFSIELDERQVMSSEETCSSLGCSLERFFSSVHWFCRVSGSYSSCHCWSGVLIIVITTVSSSAHCSPFFATLKHWMVSHSSLFIHSISTSFSFSFSVVAADDVVHLFDSGCSSFEVLRFILSKRFPWCALT